MSPSREQPIDQVRATATCLPSPGSDVAIVAAPKSGHVPASWRVPANTMPPAMVVVGPIRADVGIV